MNSRASHSSGGGRARAVLAGASLLAVVPALADTTFVPHLGAAAAWTDNIALAPPGQTHDGEIWQLLPGIFLKHDSQNLHVTLDYEVRAYFYGGSQHGHDTYQTGSLFADTQVLPDWLFLDLGGSEQQGTVNPSQNPTISPLFPTGNLANESTASATPIIRHQFSWVQIDARYAWGFTHYQPVGTVDTALPNTHNQDGSFRLSNIDPNARITWDASYLRQETTYTNVVAPRWLYEAAQADLGWLVTPAVRLLARGGKETDLLTSVANGGLGATSWAGGFDWNPDPMNELRLMAGHRFFGNTYEALAKHRSRLLTLQVSYSEEPTSYSNRFLPQAPAQPLVVIPGVPVFQRLTSDAYVLKLLDARVALTGRLTEVGLSLDTREQKYLTVNGVTAGVPASDQSRGATLYATRRMGAQLQAGMTASYMHTDLREGVGETYNDQHYTAQLTDQVGLRTSVILAVDHWERSGSQVFKVNMVTLTANMTFGNAPGGAFPNTPIVPNPVAPGPVAPASIAAPLITPGAMTPALLALGAPAAPHAP
jgi:hypothetical protein